MKTYKVYFQTTVEGEMTVEANNEEEAKDMVESNALTEYCGNGGIDKLVGVDDENISINAPDNFHVEEIEEEDEEDGEEFDGEEDENENEN